MATDGPSNQTHLSLHPCTNVVMDSLPEAIASRLRHEKIELVLHIGAGSTIDPLLSTLGASRMVLIEGDNRSADLLRRQVDTSAGVEVICAIVAADHGTSTWHKCSLPWLSGLVDPARWRAFYPRIATVAREDVSTASIKELLNDYATGERCLLVMDVPGLEATLLSSLTGETTEKFEWIVIRHAGAAWQEDSGTSLVETLGVRGHEVLFSDVESQPLWTTTLLCLDRVRVGGRLKAQADSANAKLALANEERNRLKAVAEAQGSRIEALCVEVEQLHAERQNLLETVMHESRVREDLLSQLSAADQRLDEVSSSSGHSIRVMMGAILRAWRAQREAERQACRAETKVRAPRVEHEMGRVVQAGGGESTASQLGEVTRQLEEARLLLASRDADDRGLPVRQRRYEDEMIKVSAQIELIKDVLLRGEDL